MPSLQLLEKYENKSANENTKNPVFFQVRPVVEEIEEPNYPQPSPTSAFDEEVNKLGLSLQTGTRDDEEGI